MTKGRLKLPTEIQSKHIVIENIAYDELENFILKENKHRRLGDIKLHASKAIREYVKKVMS